VNRFKVVGLINYFFGGAQILFSLAIPLLVIPKISRLYEEFDQADISLGPVYAVCAGFFVFGAANLFFARKLFSKTEVKSERYFQLSLVLAIINFFATGVFYLSGLISAVIPIYSLTTSF